VSFLNKNDASTRTSTETRDTSIVNTDNRVGGDNAVFGGNVALNPMDSPIGVLTLSTTDQGAVKAGLDATLESLKFAESTQGTNTSLAKDLTSQAFDLAQQARQSETSGAINVLVKVLAVVAVIAIAGYVYVHRKG
jgi:transcriptional regulator with GAF, ATPase, and Fis domain